MVGKYARTLLEDAFLDDFADDDYRGGYEDYLSTCADFFERAAQGHPVRKPLIKVLPMALGIGLGLALLVCDAEGKNEVRSSGRGGGRLCDRRGTQSDGAV